MIEPAWTDIALAPPRAHGPVAATGLLRAAPEDFEVEEDLGFAPAGQGAHLLVQVRKRNANTEWVARELARAAGCRPGEVGFAGLKDRRAVAVQWFSVPRSSAAAERLPGLRHAEFEVIAVHGHTRKLPRGALAGNRFRIRIRDLRADRTRLEERLALLRRDGVPNYFGAQRFGRHGANLERIAAGLGALGPRERGFILSAARSLIFNAVLAERVREGTWQRFEPGDVANLDGRGSIFAVPVVDEVLQERCDRLEIHPTGPLWGAGELLTTGGVRDRELRVALPFGAPCSLLLEAGLTQERRSLRLTVRELSYAHDGPDLVLQFGLARGSFATTVLREIGEFVTGDEGEDHD